MQLIKKLNGTVSIAEEMKSYRIVVMLCGVRMEYVRDVRSTYGVR